MNEPILDFHLMGIDTGHNLDFVYDRQADGHNKVLIMCFRTPAQILTINGIEKAFPGDFIIQSPSFRHYHCSVENAAKGFRNDWLHADYESIKPLVREFKFSWNELIATDQESVLTYYIKVFQKELSNQDDFSSTVISHTLYAMFLNVFRAVRESNKKRNTMSATERNYYEQFKKLRTMMVKNCIKSYKVKELAQTVNLSPERFSPLYKTFFNSTPISDVIDARISMARRILVYSTNSVQETARLCGFNDFYYFSRLFKRRAGVSPSAYRKMHS